MEGEGDHGVDSHPVRDTRNIPIPHNIVSNALAQDDLGSRLYRCVGGWGRGVDSLVPLTVIIIMVVRLV